MELREFIQLTESVVGQFIDKVDPETADFLRTMSWGGEWGQVIECLTATLIQDQIPVSPAQRDGLALLIENLNEPISQQVNELNVVPSVPVQKAVEGVEASTGSDQSSPPEPPSHT